MIATADPRRHDTHNIEIGGTGPSPEAAQRVRNRCAKSVDGKIADFLPSTVSGKVRFPAYHGDSPLRSSCGPRRAATQIIIELTTWGGGGEPPHAI